MTDDKAKQSGNGHVVHSGEIVEPPNISPEAAMLAATAPELAEDVMPPSVEVDTPAGQRPGVAPEIWVVGLIGVIVILLVVFSFVL